MKRLRAAWYLMLLVCVLLIAWIAFPTSFVIGNAKSTFAGREVVFSRTTPFGTIKSVDWRAEITMIDSGFECRTSWKQDRFQQQAGNAVEYTASPDLWPCLDLKQPFTYWSIRRAYLFGLIPLRTSDSLDVVVP